MKRVVFRFDSILLYAIVCNYEHLFIRRNRKSMHNMSYDKARTPLWTVG